MRAWINTACAQTLVGAGLTADDLSDKDVVIGIATRYRGGIEGFHDDAPNLPWSS
jgi:hypothetical protein